ncbi:MAG TPA: TRAP transporter small permease subunit [Hyphomicrobiaceae bacterium]|jgi:TRAP-type mannitol/chloroaromatic compound transport system permease small subunit|nr:TRAP transporter small permease subunit [Hyphomicrobiaceae bacterium]
MLGRRLDWALSQVPRALKWLALPISLLLFLQWPLRDYVQAYSREANDLGQWLFALYVAASVLAATRAGTHLATDAVARRYRPSTRRLIAHAGNLLALMPWALCILATATPTILRSLGQLERFPETGNPGYFLVKLALWVLAVGVLASAIVDLIKPDARDEP